MRNITSILLLSIFLSGCKFSRSAEKDLVSGLTSTGKDLSCEDVYLMAGDKKVTGSTFIYGETFNVYFDDVRGFTSENGYVFPGMALTITNKEGETILQADDLYAGYTEGMNFSPLQLNADITAADPIKSKGEYKLSIKIWDKKGTGTFISELNFNVADNENITAKPDNVAYDEIYIFSQGGNRVITDNIVSFDDNIYFIVEGLKGFSEENGMVFPGLALEGFDANKNVILDYEDLFAEYSESGIASSDFSSRVSAHFKLTGTAFNNPFRCELKIWDKKGNASLTVTTEMIVK